MPNDSDSFEPSFPTGTPSFDRPEYVKVEPGDPLPEGFLAGLSDIEVLELSRYFEPEADLTQSQWKIDPYTEINQKEQKFHMILRVGLHVLEEVSGEEAEILELATMTIQFTFHVPKIQNHIVNEGDETQIRLRLSGPALAEMLRTAYDGARGAWCTEMGSSRYGNVLLPHANIEKLMQDFFGASMPSSSGS